MKTKQKDEKFRISTKIKYSDDHDFKPGCLCENELKVHFVVDEVARTTVAILKDDNLPRFFDMAVDNGLASTKEMQMCKKYHVNDWEKFEIRVKAKCSPEDKFDRNLGMRIALEKANIVRFKIIKEIIREIQNQTYRNFFPEMNMLMHRVDHIDKVIEKRDIKKAKLQKKIADDKKREEVKKFIEKK